MTCLECGSQAVTERHERTAQGYRRFRCRACGKQFNERSDTLLNRAQYPSDVIALGCPAQKTRDTMRHDLDGRAVEPVSEEYRTGAVKALQGRRRRSSARPVTTETAA